MVIEKTTRLYYAAHITIKPLPRMDFTGFTEAWEDAYPDWKTSCFEADNVDGIAGMWFVSARGSNLDAFKAEVHKVIQNCRGNGAEVLRWKIEETVLDSKYGDRESALGAIPPLT